jgi:hypothetical protein
VLSGGTFDGADFKDAEMHHAVIAGADLTHARGLTQEQVDEACSDSKTRLPSGLTARTCIDIRVIIRQAGSSAWSHAMPAPPAPPAAPAPPAPPTPTRYLVAPSS